MRLSATPLVMTMILQARNLIRTPAVQVDWDTCRSLLPKRYLHVIGKAIYLKAIFSASQWKQHTTHPYYQEYNDTPKVKTRLFVHCCLSCWSRSRVPSHVFFPATVGSGWKESNSPEWYHITADWIFPGNEQEFHYFSKRNTQLQITSGVTGQGQGADFLPLLYWGIGTVLVVMWLYQGP